MTPRAVSSRRVPLAEIGEVDKAFVAERSANRKIDFRHHRISTYPQHDRHPLQLAGGSNDEAQTWRSHVFSETLATLKRFRQPDRATARAGRTTPRPR